MSNIYEDIKGIMNYIQNLEADVLKKTNQAIEFRAENLRLRGNLIELRDQQKDKDSVICNTINVILSK